MLWKSKSVADHPVCNMSRWAIIRRPDGACVVAGHNLDEGWGRVSSRIVEINREALTLKTRSGRVYQLVGPPGWDGDGIYVFESMYGSDYEDVTIEVLETPDFNFSTSQPLN